MLYRYVLYKLYIRGSPIKTSTAGIFLVTTSFENKGRKKQ